MSARLDQLGLAFVAVLFAAAIVVPLMSLATAANSAFFPRRPSHGHTALRNATLGQL